jgi:hypothetical protein
MKTETTCYENDLTGVLNVKECGIVLNAQTFQILSRMYTNPIRSILQELGCNAWDSHVAAGNQKRPFDVTIPSSNNSEFSIRDYGEGMSKDKIYNVYVDYMSSDKRNTNFQTGYYGLGSKTPFAYVNSFNVEVFYNGVYTKYRLCLNGNGYPELHEFESCDTTEDNGVRISFDTKSEDYINWRHLAKDVYRWFYPCPNVQQQDGEVVEIESVEYDLESDIWKLGRNLSSSYIVMGNVAYEISRNKLNTNHYCDSNFLSHGLVFYCNIGQLDIVPSRDNLEYTDKTVKKIQSLIDSVKKELYEALRIQLHNRQFKSYFDACLFLKEFKSNHRYIFNGCKEQKLFYDGKKLEFEYLRTPEAVRKFYWVDSKIKQDKAATAIHLLRGNHYYFDDLKVGGVCRIKECMRTSEHHGSVYLLPFSTAMLTYATDVLGITDVKLTSQLPHQVTKRGSRKNVVKCYKYNPEGNGPRTWRHSNSRYWKEQDIDLNSGQVHYYVIIDRYTTENKGYRFSIQNLKHSASELGIEVDDHNVYGLTESIVSRVRNKPNWIKLVDYVKNKLELENTDRLQKIQCVDKTFDMLEDAEHIVRPYRDSPELFQDCELIVKFYNDYETLKKQHSSSSKKRSSITQLCRVIGESIKDKDGEEQYDKDIVDLYNLIKEKYPLIFYIETYRMSEEVVNYIANMVKAVNTYDTVNVNLECV